MSRALIFHHSDLDGIGVKIVGIIIAKRLGYDNIETFKCNYNDVNEIVSERLHKDLSDVGLIIIADISVNPEVAEFINTEIYGNCNINVVLRDHHATAYHLNQYKWAEVHEKVDGIERCGTWQLAKSFPEQITDMDAFLTLVDDWDTWKWVENGNEYAKKLNSLLQVVGEKKFTNYMTVGYTHLGEFPKCFQTASELIFDNWANSMIEAHQLFIEKTAKNCEKNMYLTRILVSKSEDNKKHNYCYNTGIVFCNNDISDVANIVLSNHPEIDILMLIGFPNSVSFRTQKQLEVPLGDIAKAFTGSGGGHPKSAGAVISDSQVKSEFTHFLHHTSRGRIRFCPLEPSKED